MEIRIGPPVLPLARVSRGGSADARRVLSGEEGGTPPAHSALLLAPGETLGYLEHLVAHTNTSVLKPLQFFVSWSGVLTLAYKCVCMCVWLHACMHNCMVVGWQGIAYGVHAVCMAACIHDVWRRRLMTAHAGVQVPKLPQCASFSMEVRPLATCMQHA